MRTCTVLLALVALLGVGTATAGAAKPPSFALWTARWSVETDRTIVQPMNACAKAFGEASTKAGSCMIATARAAYKLETPRWTHQIASISKSQSVTCRTAIHRFWIASSKAQAAMVIYLNASHPGITIVGIASDLKHEPLATLSALSDAAKSRAIRICG